MAHKVEHEVRKITLLYVLGSVFGALFVLSGIFWLIVGKYLTGFCILFAGIIIIPETNKLIGKNLHLDLSRGLRIGIAIFLLFVAGMGMIFGGVDISAPSQTSAPTNEESVVVNCATDWHCSKWSSCSTSGKQTRTCTDANSCGTTSGKPITTQSCAYLSPCEGITLGMSKEDVLAAYGEPTNKQKMQSYYYATEYWYFGFSCQIIFGDIMNPGLENFVTAVNQY